MYLNLSQHLNLEESARINVDPKIRSHDLYTIISKTVIHYQKTCFKTESIIFKLDSLRRKNEFKGTHIPDTLLLTLLWGQLKRESLPLRADHLPSK